MSDQPTTRVEWGLQLPDGGVWLTEPRTREAVQRAIRESGVGRPVCRRVSTTPWAAERAA